MKKLFLPIVFVLFTTLSYSQITLVLNPGPGEGKDANIRGDMPNSNYGNSMDFIANAFTAGDFFIQRSLIQFNFSSLPANATILSARLSLYCNLESGHAQLQYGENECLLQRIVQNWDESSVTWGNQPLTTNENEVVIPQSTAYNQDYPDIDVTNLVNDMISFPDDSYGLMIKLSTEDVYRTMVFGSSDHANPSRWPKLTITYDTCQALQVSFSHSYVSSDSLTVAFSDNSVGLTHWLWVFGDGYQSTLQNPVHTYPETGVYIACLEGGNGCSSMTTCDTIPICNTVDPEFTYINSNDRLISFIDSSKYSTSWNWDFGDGFFSNLRNPVHYFDTYGEFNVCLNVSNSCSSSIRCHTIQAVPNSLAEITGSSVRIFPNPSNSGFKLEATTPVQKSRLQIFDLTGRIILDWKPPQNKNTYQIPAMKQGIYILVMQLDGEIQYTKLFAL